MRRATFVALLMGLSILAATPGVAADGFDDVPADHLFSAEIAWLAGEGVTRGCNPPDNTRFCPDDAVTRGQMAAFLVRALGLTGEGPSFEDTVGHVFEEDVSRLAAAGITRGCNPPDNTRFCPDDAVTRGQMAAFLFRAFATEGPALEGVVQISAGTFHTCAVTEEGAVYCWGGNAEGQLGDGSTDPSSVPVRVRDPDDNSSFLTDVTQVSAGAQHSCAVTERGTAYCWGFNLFGRLGDGTSQDRTTAVPVRNPADDGLLTGLSEVDAGTSHSCAVTEGGAAYCWGGNHLGALGDGTDGDLNWSLLPVRVRDPAGSGNLTGVRSISAGHDFTCGVVEPDGAYCWGVNDFSQLGDGTDESSPLPVRVRDPAGSAALAQVAGISGRSDHACAVVEDGSAYCWGNNFRGSLGDGTTVDRAQPARVRNPGDDGYLVDVARVGAGTGHSCAVSDDGAAYCWGNNFRGALGDGTDDDGIVPVRVRNVFNTAHLAQAVDITAGFQHSCAVTRSGTAYCWGDNEDGQLGDGTTEESSLPVPVPPAG